jgi:hypothetical protein
MRTTLRKFPPSPEYRVFRQLTGPRRTRALDLEACPDALTDGDCILCGGPTQNVVRRRGSNRRVRVCPDCLAYRGR